MITSRQIGVIAAILVSTLCASAGFASVTINLSAGELFQSDDTTPIPTGSLLQLVASTTDNVFTAPSPTSFTGGSADDQVVATFDTNDFLGPGSTISAITFNLGGNLNAGDELLLRWWPSLTISASTPGTGATFGQFRTNAVENNSDTGWFVPADGSTIALNFLDTAGGGTEPNSAGAASFSTSAVPEPSTWAGSALVAVALGARILRRRKLAHC